jgi:hypothetical protein
MEYVVVREGLAREGRQAFGIDVKAIPETVSR